MKRYCFALDLINDKEKIEQYQHFHKNVWPEVCDNIKARGIIDMQIWQIENHLFMIMDVENNFDQTKADAIALNDKKNQEWEALMSQFQKPLPSAKEEEKWLNMIKIFDLSKC